ncbi:MAG: hypothetical protein GX038_01945 [Erysipelothrix sp.]|nr:hypothetical protein [Erysipelothrix sp.]
MFNFIKKTIRKSNYQFLAPVVLDILNTKISFEDIKTILKIPFNNLSEYLDVISNFRFENLTDTDNLGFYIGFTKLVAELKEISIKKFIYPMFLLVVSFVLTFYFSTTFGPSIIEMLEGFDVHNKQLYFVLHMVNLLKVIWIILIVGLIILLLIIHNKDLRYVLFIRYHNLKIFGFVKNILSSRFIFVYQYLFKLNLTTQEILKEIKEVKGLGDVKWIGYHIESNLSQGKDLLSAIDLEYFNPFMIIYFKNGFYTNKLSKSLDTYQKTLDKIIKNQCERYILYFKTFVYAYIIIFVGIYYLFLFQPLSILEGLS